MQRTPVSHRTPSSRGKIRGLINSLPALSSRFLSPTTNNASTIVDSNGRPIPPPGAARIQDPELISLLSNPSIMSGSDGRRQSVWSMLDAIEPPRVSDAGTMDQSQSEYAVSDRSSIMMYSPLIPNADSVIELAALEDVPTISEDPTPARWSWPVWPTFWPFGDWTAKSPDFVISESPPETNEPPAGAVQERKEVPIQRVWKPSTTKLSFETTWWGYRLYLPPPVLSILDDQSVEATRQATTITAALTWFFTNLPISTFPPPLQSAMFLLQRLVPFISYIGTFISWSWSTIRGFDRGHGVILTATWLLPIALIPSTWHARDVPPPSSPASPMPIPSISILPAEEEEEELSMSIPVIVHPLPLPPTPPPEPEHGANSTPTPGPSSTYTSRSRRKDKDKDKESESKLKTKSYKSTLRKLKRTLT
ncbi:hypothetical protein FB45DRAFT_312905 [Roridomyces roridus]|uniref:Uncharacterized protein n=1 Tax=Roridomyces roridus TaxID=1738132 RepID=A0AAD7B5T7_9AGAR|nr:hypothetical protein FB45DRAFT_312905 [Roridomyces roridus]